MNGGELEIKCGTDCGSRGGNITIIAGDAHGHQNHGGQVTIQAGSGSWRGEREILWAEVNEIERQKAEKKRTKAAPGGFWT